MPNRLGSSTSPYLRQHADNPVDWFEWSDEAFEQAIDRDVPVILSVGYATCHWCHVMAHESFEDDETAAYMNANFVNVKVDREERPDIDRIYMDAVTAMSGRGGWPMTVFLTPDAKPIYAGTYYPKQPMGHHPSFRMVLEAVVDAWQTNRQGAVEQADSIATAIARYDDAPAELPTLEHLDGAIGRLGQSFDRVNGGFGGAPKFPQGPTLELLIRTVALRPGTPPARQAQDMLTQMLTAMARGGIYDHLFGGFARYSVDSQWLIPHFEKMLYDNALLARVYLRAWQLTGSELFLATAREVLDYLDGTLADANGAIHSAEDADSEGEEGRFAVWAWNELADLLDDDLDLAAAIYGLSPEGNFEGANNLHRFSDLDRIADETGLTGDELAARKRSIDARLRDRRSGRVPPGRDDKIVTAWNGLALRAFAEAAAVLGDERYERRAVAIAEFLANECSPGGNLVRSWRDHPGHLAFAEDHAAVAIGYYSLYQANHDVRWFHEAERLVSTLRDAFAAPDGGFFATRSESTLIARPKNTQDNPTPSDNALAMEALLIHAAFTGDATAIAEGERTMAIMADRALSYPSFGGHSLAVWLTHLVGYDEVAITGDDGSDLIDVVWEAFRPQAVLAAGKGDVPLLADRGGVEGEPVAHVCHGQVCDLPVSTPNDLRRLLEVRV